jgi:NAD(P)-dependent dehydrogenase (short-subunit alcohol dehydrogenase family)
MRADLTGRCAVVTGSTRGIGKEIARTLAANGARVIVHGRQADDVRGVVAEIAARGGTAHGCSGDLAQTATLDALVRTAVDAAGGLDILVNNGALTDTFEPFLEISDARAEEILKVNLRAAVLLTKRVAAAMKRRGGGAIVNITSVGGSQRAHFDNAVYDVAKGGLDALTRALAVDLGVFGIRVNAVGPAATSELPPEGRGQELPLRRGGTPSDVANAVLYLVSDEAAFVTGQILYVDGGLSAQLRSPSAAATQKAQTPARA